MIESKRRFLFLILRNAFNFQCFNVVFKLKFSSVSTVNLMNPIRKIHLFSIRKNQPYLPCDAAFSLGILTAKSA